MEAALQSWGATQLPDTLNQTLTLPLLPPRCSK